MEQTANYAWEALKECFDEKIQREYPEIEFDSSKKEAFIAKFKDEYTNIQEKYMANKGNALDRHKQAAALICAVISENVFTSKQVPKEKMFVAKYSLSLSLGLAFLRIKVNDVLKSKKINKKIESFTEIEPFACRTKYFDVLYRNLYFEEEATGKIFVLSLANELFLLEYIAILKNGISPELLKEYGS